MPTLYWCPHQVLKATGAPAVIILLQTPPKKIQEFHGHLFLETGKREVIRIFIDFCQKKSRLPRKSPSRILFRKAVDFAQ